MATRPERKVIAIVEDDVAIRDLICDLLQSETAFAPVIAPDTAEVLPWLQGLRPDLVLLDMHLPGTDGLTLYYSLRETPATAAIPIIFLTAAHDRHLPAHARTGVIHKPFDLDVLIEGVTAALAPGP